MSEQPFEDYLTEKVSESYMRAMDEAGLNWCPLCGGTLVPHDDAVCAEKMANWKPRGLM